MVGGDGVDQVGDFDDLDSMRSHATATVRESRCTNEARARIVVIADGGEGAATIIRDATSWKYWDPDLDSMIVLCRGGSAKWRTMTLRADTEVINNPCQGGLLPFWGGFPSSSFLLLFIGFFLCDYKASN